MATAFTHSFVAAALGKTVFAVKMPPRFWVLGVLSALLPDLDVIGFRIGIRYVDMLGHRGFTHSLSFALLTAVLVTMIAFRDVPRNSPRWWALTAYFFAVTAAHGVLDAMTNGGYGIAFFSPFDTTRYFFPWQPLNVSPIGIKGFLTSRGMHILLQEFLWVWLPSLLVVSVIRSLRSRRQAPSVPGSATR